jgi:predicted metal-dependent hydrolase
MWHNEHFCRGLLHYEAGRHWEAHESWETLWRQTADEQPRLLMQGLIQVAAACHKAYAQRDLASSERLFGRALDKFERLPDAVHGVDVERLRDDTEACRDVLEHDQDRGTLHASRIPRVKRA